MKTNNKIMEKTAPGLTIHSPQRRCGILAEFRYFAVKTPAVSGRLVLALLCLTSPPLRAATVTWVGGSGDWNTAANWSTGVLPGPSDDVVIDRPGEILVTHSSGTHTVRSVLSQEAFQLSGGSLTVSNTVQVNNAFNLSGSATLRNATVLEAIGGQVITVTNFASPTLDGVILGADVIVYNGCYLYIANGLTFTGGPTITLNSSSSLSYLWLSSGTQAVGGTGQIVLAGSLATLYLGNLLAPVTLGTNVTVRGQGIIAGPTPLINQGTIQADVAGQFLTFNNTTTTNVGTLKAQNGATLAVQSYSAYSSGDLEISSGSTLNFNGAATFRSENSLVSQPSGTLRLTGSLLGTSQSPLLFSPQGSTVFCCFGTAASPQLLEVMSPDAGANPAGLSGPFAFGSLALASSTKVRLVDTSHNSPGSGPEALYVNSLSVPAGCSLDLNGLHLYARATNIAGTVIGGSVNLIPDGGALSSGRPTSGTLAAPGETDPWNFFGRAGQTYTVTVDTGGGSVISPAVNYAEVRLLDLAANILARGSNTVAGQTVQLTGVQLPADGLYRVQVLAPANHPSATGNYQITLWGESPAGGPLAFDQVMNGHLQSPSSADRWTFAAVAGQQVRFDLINVSAPGTAFDLRGPSGWIGFSNLAAGSGLITLPASGSYTLTAHGLGGSYNIAYAFRLVQTIQTDLTLGATYAGNFAGSGQAQFFRVVVPNGGPLLITLGNAGAGNTAELYVARDVLPTRSAFDYESASGFGANREILLPSASAGTMYVLVFGDYVPTPGPFTLQVAAVGVFLTSITPVRQANDAALTMTLAGAGFAAGAAVELLADGGALYPATNVSVDSWVRVTATFPPTFAPPGLYSVRVRQPDGASAVLTNAFEMLSHGAPKLEVQFTMPRTLARYFVATFYIEYANTGNAPMPAPLLLLQSADPDGSDRPILTLDPTHLFETFRSPGMPPGTAHEILVLGSGAQPGVLNAGERILLPVYYVGLLEPWDLSDTAIEMELRYWEADDQSPIDWAARKESLRPVTLDPATWDVVYNNLTADLTNTAAYVRMLSDNAQFLGRLGQRVVDVAALWGFEVQQAYGFSAIPVLASVVEASLPTPSGMFGLPRRFSSNLRARNSTGWSGRGWYTPWQTTLVVEGSGDLVKLLGEAGSARLFTRDTRPGGGYFSGVGDSARLVAVGAGLYELREPSGLTTRFRSDGRLDYVQDPNGNRVTAVYDGQGKLITLSDTSGGWISLGYNGAGLVDTVTNSAGRALSYGYDPTSTYLLNVTTDDGKSTTYTYETAGTLAQRHALTSVAGAGTSRSFAYDEHGRLNATWLAGGEQLVQFGYDSAGLVGMADALGTNYFYFDQHGLVAKATDPLGRITSFEFGDDLRLSRLVASSGESRSFTWCGCGSLTSLTDELGYTTTYSYDDLFKRLTSFTDARGNTTRYTYDAQGNRLSAIYPNGSIAYFGNYTASGLAQSSTNRRSQPITFTYTSSGQVSRRTLADGSFAQFDYDVRGNLTNVTEHPVSSPNKITSYLYAYATDGDRLRKVTYPSGRWIELFYDSFGRRDQVTDSAGGDTRYEYDTAGRLWKLRDASNATLVEYLYNAAGRLQRVNKGNGTYSTYDYDAAGQLLHLTNSAPNGSVNSRFDYTYDSRGRRHTMQILGGAWAYDYDGSGQLTHAVFTSNNPNLSSMDLQYVYDAAGNRTSVLSNGVSTAYVGNNLNQYTGVGGIGFQYDADGNLISDGTHAYGYDVLSRLVQVTGPEGTISYEYDAGGNRTATVVNGQRTEFLLDPTGLPDVVAEQDGAGNVLARHTFGLGLAGSAPAAGPLSYFDFDALGSTVGITSNNAAMAASYVYLPFGGRLYSNESFHNPFQFAGQYGVMGDSTGLDYIRSRFLASPLGRFTSSDPIGILGGDPNFYRYVHNNPVNLTDPLGTDEYSGDPGDYIWYFGHSLRRYGGKDGDWPWNPDCPIGYHPILYLNWGGSGCQRDPGPPQPPGPGGGGTNRFGSAGVSGIANSFDPNQKLGPNGAGPAHHVPPGAALSYRIDFENEPTASAPAQEVVITDQLSTNLDLATFQLTDLGFGDQMISLPPNLQHYETTVAMSCCGNLFQVQVEAGLRLDSGQFYAVFSSINPATSLPPAVEYGFLPPEDGTGRGQGHVSYLVRARTNLLTGAEIRNTALIVFDRQNSIATNQRDPHNPAAGTDPLKEALNTIDAGSPVSAVAPLPAQSGRTFVVQWSGQDDAGGSGISSFDIYVATNSGPFGLWMPGTQDGSALFTGALGQTYAFYSVARDAVGHEERPPATADAQTMVVTNAPVLATVSDVSILPGQALHITNLVQGIPVGSFVFTLGPGAPPSLAINPTNGLLSWTPDCSNGSTTNLLTVWVTDSARTNISDAVRFTVTVGQCVRPSLGQQILLAGTSGRVPINLVSSLALTNLEMTLVTAPGRLTDFTIEPLVAALCTNTVVVLGGGQYRLDLVTCPGAFLIGTQQVAWLHFTAVTNQSSAFAGLAFKDLAGHQPDGNSVANFEPQSGRVVVVGEEPLLECVFATNGRPMLILYGEPASGYGIDSRTNLSNGFWQPLPTNLTLSNLWLELTPPPSPSPVNYYRAVRTQIP
jgi:RHS repeat-associated protein